MEQPRGLILGLLYLTSLLGFVVDPFFLSNQLTQLACDVENRSRHIISHCIEFGLKLSIHLLNGMGDKLVV